MAVRDAAALSQMLLKNIISTRKQLSQEHDSLAEDLHVLQSKLNLSLHVRTHPSDNTKSYRSPSRMFLQMSLMRDAPPCATMMVSGEHHWLSHLLPHRTPHSEQMQQLTRAKLDLTFKTVAMVAQGGAKSTTETEKANRMNCPLTFVRS